MPLVKHSPCPFGQARAHATNHSYKSQSVQYKNISEFATSTQAHSQSAKFVKILEANAWISKTETIATHILKKEANRESIDITFYKSQSFKLPLSLTRNSNYKKGANLICFSVFPFFSCKSFRWQL